MSVNNLEQEARNIEEQRRSLERAKATAAIRRPKPPTTGCWPFRRTQRNDNIKQTCEELKEAFGGPMGATVVKLQNLIMAYYEDVKEQANISFDNALCVAAIGFLVLVVSVVYALVFDALNRLGITTKSPLEGWLNVSVLGLISGAVIEFIASVAFVLYGHGAKQFYAFHICPERTHRYLLAFKIAEQIQGEKDKAFHELLCVMANAPMIAPGDLGSKQTGRRPTRNT
jgi:hypothetical protein